MRTLRQIDNEIMDLSKARAAELKGSINIMTENEIIAMQAQARYNELYVRLYHLLEDVEKFLDTKWEGPDGGWDEQAAKDALKNRIVNI